MEQYFSITETPQERWVWLGASELRGAAQTWWCVRKATLEDSTWKEFITALEKHFAPIQGEEAARQRLWAVRQVRSVQEYIREFHDTILDIPNISEEEKMDRFVHNLKDSVRRGVMLRRPKNFVEACYEAELYDQLEYGGRGKWLSSQRKRPSSPFRPSFPRTTSHSFNQPMPMEIGARHRPKPNMASVKCHNCGKYGHYQYTCDQPKREKASPPSTPSSKASNPQARTQGR